MKKAQSNRKRSTQEYVVVNDEKIKVRRDSLPIYSENEHGKFSTHEIIKMLRISGERKLWPKGNNE
jgi:hypothetical protein